MFLYKIWVDLRFYNKVIFSIKQSQLAAISPAKIPSPMLNGIESRPNIKATKPRTFFLSLTYIIIPKHNPIIPKREKPIAITNINLIGKYISNISCINNKISKLNKPIIEKIRDIIPSIIPFFCIVKSDIIFILLNKSFLNAKC